MGGTAKALRRLTIWCSMITLTAIFFIFKFVEVKRNYTNLHHRVNQMERILGISKK